MKGKDKRVNTEENTSMLLRSFPPDVKALVIARQTKIRKSCKCQMSLEQVIYKMIKQNAEIMGVRQTISRQPVTRGKYKAS